MELLQKFSQKVMVIGIRWMQWLWEETDIRDVFVRGIRRLELEDAGGTREESRVVSRL